MTSVNVTTTKNTVTVNGETRVVTVKTAGPQGTFTDGNLGDVTVSSNGTNIVVNAGAIDNANIASNAAIDLTKLATGALPTAITVTSANISDLSIVNADINASAAIAGTKITPNFGSQNITTTGQITIGGTLPTLNFLDSDSNPDFMIKNQNGGLEFRDTTAGSSRLIIRSSGEADFYGTVDCNSGLNVTGDISVTGTVDGRDVAADGTKLDGIETGATADQTAAEIKTLLNSNGIVNSNVDASAAIAGTKISPDFGSQNIVTTGTINASGNRIYISGVDPALDFTDTNNNSDFRLQNDNGTLKVKDQSNSNAVRFQIQSDGTIASFGNHDFGAGIDVTGNITCNGLIDGVDIAARDTLFGGLTSSSGVLTNGVTATTQSASDNSTKVATTAYTDTAIANLVDSAPGTLNTLNELASALGDDANFSTTVTNSIATKLPLAGGTLTGNLTIETTEPQIFLKDSNNNDDFTIRNTNGVFTIRDSTNAVDRLTIDSNGKGTFTTALDVTGDLTVESTLPQFILKDTNNDDDFTIKNTN